MNADSPPSAPAALHPRGGVRAAIGRDDVVGAIALGMATLVSIVVLTTELPSPPPGEGPADFSLDQARNHVSALAQAPRPVGSSAHRVARDYLLDQLQGMGLDPHRQSLPSARSRWGETRVAMVENVVARIVGSEGGPAVLLMAHYDTRPTTPGAGDDASGVATILETARTLLAGPPPRRDVILLFTDAEELGLLGARAFVEEHPWRADVGLVFNFEGRGRGGPVFMFETGPDNARLIGSMAELVERPVASSLAADIYRQMPNDTDFSPFRDRGIPGLNFAFIEGMAAYHTALDTAEHLDPRSLAHHGAYAVPLTRHWADQGAEAFSARGDAVFFELWGGQLLVYPRSWAGPLAVLAWIFLALLLIWAARRRRFRLARVGVGLAMTTAALIVGGLTARIGWFLVRFWTDLEEAPYGIPFAHETIGVGLLLLALAAAAKVLAFGRRWAEPAELALGAGVAWAILAIPVTAVMPGASYILIWPLVVWLLAMEMSLRGKDGPPSLRRLVVFSAVGGLGAILLVVPLVKFIHVSLTVHLVELSAVVAILVLALYTPALLALGRRLRWACLAAAAVALVLVVGTAAFTAADAGHPDVRHLGYHLDADHGEASWWSFDDELHPWVREAMKRAQGPGRAPFALGDDLDAWSAPAEPVDLEPPWATLVRDHWSDGRRTTQLQVASRRGAPVVRLAIAMGGATEGGGGFSPSAIQVRERRFMIPADAHPAAGERYRITLYGVPSVGLGLEIESSTREPLEILLSDQSWGLPAAIGLVPMPAGLIPTPSWTTDATLVSSRFVVPGLDG